MAQVKGNTTNAKDANISPFEAARKLMEGSARLSLMDKMELVFQDADLVPLLIQENYVNQRPDIARTDITRLKVRVSELINEGRGICTKSAGRYCTGAISALAWQSV